jgi:hypothetical protein
LDQAAGKMGFAGPDHTLKKQAIASRQVLTDFGCKCGGHIR